MLIMLQYSFIFSFHTKTNKQKTVKLYSYSQKSLTTELQKLQTSQKIKNLK